MSEKIKSALAKLDPSNDNHWTAEGFPRLDAVRLLAADGSLSREAVTNAIPGFARGNAAKPAVVAPVLGLTQSPANTEVAAAAAPGSLEAACAGIVDRVNENLENNEQLPVVAAVDEHGQLKLDLAQAREALDELIRAAHKMELLRKEANAKVDKLVLAVERTAPKGAATDAVQGYLAQQRRNLEERGRRIRATAGVNLRDFLPQRAPVDIRPRKKG